MTRKEKVLVSACLTGVRCRYDGRDAANDGLAGLLKGGEPLPVCPEELGGLPTPRPPARIEGGDGRDVLEGRGRVVDETGRDVTRHFIDGAKKCLALAVEAGAVRAVLKEKSPSCGVSYIKKEGLAVEGTGVLASLLRREGFLLQGL